MRLSDSMSRRLRGFTLIELIFVIAIIAVLVALLMPVFTGFTESGKRTKCMSNQRQLMSGVALYAADHEGFLPFPNWGNTDGQRGWLYTPPDKTEPKHTEAGLVFPYVRTTQVYFCPLDKPTPEQLAMRDQRLSSYCMNGAVCRYGADVLPLAQLPSNGICFWEQDEGDSGFWFNDGSNSPSEAISRRHKGGAIVTCFDGHSEWMKWSEYTEELGRSPGRLWCNPTSDSGH